MEDNDNNFGDGADGAPMTGESDERGLKIAALEAELADARDRLLRALAETENVRRRGQRETDEARRFAATGFAKDMLSVSDNLRRALDSVAGTAGADGLARTFVEGVEATERALLAAFERHGIKKLEPRPGERFDPNLHEAMFEVPTAAQPPGAIVQVMQPGYIYHDRLLRPAMVGVAKAAPGAPESVRVNEVV
jgi:molecular chaperone GrpE